MRIHLLVLAFCIGFSINAYSQEPFPCDARFYQVFGFEGDLASYNLETDQFAFAPNDAGVRLNAAGRNPLDGFAYMIDIDNLHLLRMASDGSVTSLGPVTGLPVNNYSAGDFWRDGLLYVNPGSNGGIFNTFYGINVNTNTVENVVDVQGALFAIPDIAHNVVDDLMYAVTSESPFGGSEVPAGNLIAINLETATFEIIGPTGVPAGAGLASIYADASDRVYGSNRFDPALLYEFNTDTGEATAVGRSILLAPNTGPIDGFYCPQDLGPFMTTLDVTIQGNGEGGVLSTNPGIDCNSSGTMDCDEIYNFGDMVTLSATPLPGSTFTGWSGDAACTGDPLNPVLNLTMNMDISCIATFVLIPVMLDVTIEGNGEGGVLSTNPAIDCNSTGTMDCDETYNFGTMVTLTATPLVGSNFTGWSGDAACTGDPTNPVLNLTMNMDISCIATFDLIPVTLDVTIQGTGDGGVVSANPGIDCNSSGTMDCDEIYNFGDMVTLSATPLPGSTFTGWSGDAACTGDPLNPVLNLTMNMDISCIATFDLIPVDLDVTILGTGDGGVVSANPGIDCNSTGTMDCDETYNFGTSVTLTATPEVGSSFTGWSGDAACTGDPMNPVLNLTMNMDISCIATFDLIPVTLDVTILGTGDGGVVSTNPGIDCSSTGANDCDEIYDFGTMVTLTATPEVGSSFTGWSGDAACTGDPTNPVLNLNMDMDISCIATFDLIPVTLDVTIQGTGDGGVVSTNPGIDCSSTGANDCDETYNFGTSVTLTATPEVGSSFTGWSGDAACTGDPTNPVLNLNMDMDISCIATFDLIPVTLDVTILGGGDGEVVSTNPGIDCSSTGANDCDEIYDFGTMVTLTAAAEPGSIFTGWSGDAACTGDPLNTVLNLTMDMDISCIATFEIIIPPPVNLDVMIQGSGDGGVMSTNPGIDCSSTGATDCDELYGFGTMVTLTAVPEPGSFFAGWSGDPVCTTGPQDPVLNLTMNMDISCIATFEIIPPSPVTLDVMIEGSGDGGVVSTNPGIDCSSTGANDCDEVYTVGTMVVLIATPEPGSIFVGWSGDLACTTDPQNMVLNLNMNMDISCIATFDIIPPSPVILDVTILGNGDGRVDSTNPGITCSSTGDNDCDELYNIDTMVTLTADPDPGSFFAGWSGDPECTADPQNPILNLTMNMDIGCIAIFEILPPNTVSLDVIIEGNGSCIVTSSPDVINCPGDCTEIISPPGLTVDLTVITDPFSTFIDWTGDCNDLNPATSITVNENSTCIATCIQSEFVLNPIFPGLDDNINSISAENASPNGNVAFVWGQFPGSFIVGGRVCNGTELGIRNPRLLKIERANDFGVSTYIFYIPLFGDFEFAIQLQAVDIETCRTSNIVPQIIRKDEGG